MLWTLNGVAFYVLIFATGQSLRLVPVTWGVFPAALSTTLQYASLNFPVDESWTRYNGLQQLTYFITVFIAAPVSIATGLMQSPAVSNRLGLLGTVLNRQAARSIHFISFCWFVLFILASRICAFGGRVSGFGGLAHSNSLQFIDLTSVTSAVGITSSYVSANAGNTSSMARAVPRPENSSTRDILKNIHRNSKGLMNYYNSSQIHFPRKLEPV